MMDSLKNSMNECFWDDIKNLLSASIHRAFLNQEITFLKITPQLKC